MLYRASELEDIFGTSQRENLGKLFGKVWNGCIWLSRALVNTIVNLQIHKYWEILD